MMGDGLNWISENPARTFWEACQGTMMYQLFLYMDARQPALAFGRFDQYTWPFLKADLEAGRLTMDEAQEIVDAFFLKSNCFYRANNPKLAQTTASASPITTLPSAASTGTRARTPPTPSPIWCWRRSDGCAPRSTISMRVNKTPGPSMDCAIETTRLVAAAPLPERRRPSFPA
jgi:formate C-acetyltransferase